MTRDCFISFLLRLISTAVVLSHLGVTISLVHTVKLHFRSSFSADLYQGSVYQAWLLTSQLRSQSVLTILAFMI